MTTGETVDLLPTAISYGIRGLPLVHGHEVDVLIMLSLLRGEAGNLPNGG